MTQFGDHDRGDYDPRTKSVMISRSTTTLSLTMRAYTAMLGFHLALDNGLGVEWRWLIVPFVIY
ncbi:MAG: hypothetical protein R3E79_32735 [Caldilineaceae bacterium]